MHYKHCPFILFCHPNVSLITSINNFFNLIDVAKYQLCQFLPKKSENGTRNIPSPTSQPSVFNQQPASPSIILFSANQTTALDSSPLAQNETVVEFIAHSQKIFATPKPARATISAESLLTFAQRPHIEKNRRKAIQRHDECLRRANGEDEYSSKPPPTNYNHSQNNQLQTFFIDE